MIDPQPDSIPGAVVILLGSLVLYIQNRKQNKGQKEVKETLKNTFEKNGGSSIKDQLDRIEQQNLNLDSRMTVLDQRLARYRSDFERALINSNVLRDEMVQRIDHLEVQFQPKEDEK